VTKVQKQRRIDPDSAEVLDEIFRMRAQGLSYTAIGKKLHMTRQAVQQRYKRAGGDIARQWRVDKPPNAVHTAEVRVLQQVNDAALARLDTMAEQGLGRYTMRELCRRSALLPLDDEQFPQLDAEFSGASPGSRGGELQVLRWQTRWAEFSTAQEAIHKRGYSLSQVIEARLKVFALSGVVPPEPELQPMEGTE